MGCIQDTLVYLMCHSGVISTSSVVRLQELAKGFGLNITLFFTGFVVIEFCGISLVTLSVDRFVVLEGSLDCSVH